MQPVSVVTDADAADRLGARGEEALMVHSARSRTRRDGASTPGAARSCGAVGWRLAAIAVCVALLGSILVSVSAPPADASTSLNPASLTAGYYHTCVLNTGGQVLCWGRNSRGQLGDGTTTNRSVPSVVPGIVGATAIAAGQEFTCAVVAGGAVKCWGKNSDGQLGDGTSGTDRLSPIAVSGLTGVVKLTATWNNTCALTSSGQVKCWGQGGNGANGDNTTFDRTSPVSVLGVGSGVTDIAGGDFHNCAITASTVVRCWGRNNEGQTRGAAGPQANLAVAVASGTVSGATSLALSPSRSCAGLNSGSVKCWGDNSFGALGNGTTTDSATPVTVLGVTTAVQVAAGYNQACATLADGTVKCWGGMSNLFAEGAPGSSFPTPATVSGLAGAVGVVAGLAHVCASLGQGVTCWGNNTYGQLGNNTMTTPSGLVNAIGVTPSQTATYVRPVLAALGYAASTSYSGDPVGTAFGNFFDHWTDLRAPDRAFGLDVDRWYNSMDNRTSAIGMGWRTSFSDSVVENGDGSVTLTLAEGRSLLFAPDGAGQFENALEFGGVLTVEGSGLYSVTMPDGEVWTFDADGLIESKTRWDGVSATVTRDGSRRVDEVDASTGESVDFVYSGTRLASIESSDGREVSYQYHPTSGFLVGAVDPAGKTTVIEPDASGRVTAITDPTGVELVRNTFDLSGRVASQVTPQGTTTFAYDAPTRTTVVTHVELGESLTYAHDTLGRVLSVADDSAASMTRTYDADGWLATGEDRRGTTVLSDFDERGNPESITDPSIGEVTLGYDGEGRVDTITTPGQGETTFVYDPGVRMPKEIIDANHKSTTQVIEDGLVTSQTDADGVTLEFRYYPSRLLHEVEDEYGNITRYDYDGAGKRTLVEQPSGAQTVMEYDDVGRVKKVIVADDGETLTTYDDAGRVDTVTDPELGATNYDYDPDTGLLAAVTDERLRTTTYTYDTAGRLKKTVFPDSTFRENFYGVLGRIDSTKDELLRETQYEYDANGNVILVRDPEGGEARTVYDEKGRVEKEIDPLDRETVYGYDDDSGLLETVTTAAGTVTYGYDAVGRIETVEDLRGGVTTTKYTDAGRIDWVKDPVDLVTSWGYDDAGRLSAHKLPGDRATTTEYDVNGRVHRQVSPEGNETLTTYDGLGRILTVTNPAGVTTTNTWTKTGKIDSTTKDGEGTVNYHYFPDGTLEWVDDALGHRTSFEYDNRGRLATRTDPDLNEWLTDYNPAGELVSETDPLNRTTTYTYDGAGRLKTIDDPSGRSTSNSYDLAGQLTGWTATDGVDTSTATFSYDAAGNRDLALIEGPGVGDRGWGYYNGAGDLLAQINSEGRIVIYQYDAAGRRTALHRPDGTGLIYNYDPTTGRLDNITPTELAGDNFTLVGGSPDSGKWTTTTTGGAIASVNGSNGIAQLNVTSTAGSMASMASTVGSTTAGDTAADVQFADPAAGGTVQIHQRYVDSNNHYSLQMTAGSPTAKITKTVGGTTSTIATFGVLDNSATQRVRFEVDGSTVQARTWRPGDEEEPQTWDASVTDTAITAPGGAGIDFTTSSTTPAASMARIDNWVHNDPDTALQPLVAYGWDDDDNLLTEALPDGTSRDWSWTDGRITGLTQDLPGADHVSSLGYDASGRINSETVDGSTTGYDYDDAGQLSEIDPAAGPTVAVDYDNLGRRIEMTNGTDGTTWDYDDAGQLKSATLTAGSSTTYTYDGAGRRTSETTGTDVTTYAYNPQGQLLQTTYPDTSTDLRGYDDNGLLDGITHSAPGSTSLTQFDWDLNAAVPTLMSTNRTDIVGFFTSVESLGSSTVKTPGAPWAALQEANTAAPLASDIYTSTLTSDTDLGHAAADSYNAWGAASSADTWNPTLGYRGEITIGGDSYLRARTYDAGAAAFTETDPLNGVKGTSVLNNPYHYVNNDPLNLLDPTGESPFGDNSVGISGMLAFQSTPVLDPATIAWVSTGAATVQSSLLLTRSVAPILPVMSASPAGAAIIGMMLGIMIASSLAAVDAIEKSRDCSDGRPGSLDLGNCKGPSIYHYTSAGGREEIVECKCIRPSLSDDNHAAFGPGVYWTDIAPAAASAVTAGQFSVALTTTPFDGYNGKFDFFVAVDVLALIVPPVWKEWAYGPRFPGYSIFLSPTVVTLPVKIRSDGSVR